MTWKCHQWWHQDMNDEWSSTIPDQNAASWYEGCWIMTTLLEQSPMRVRSVFVLLAWQLHKSTSTSKCSMVNRLVKKTYVWNFSMEHGDKDITSSHEPPKWNPLRSVLPEFLLGSQSWLLPFESFFHGTASCPLRQRCGTTQRGIQWVHGWNWNLRLKLPCNMGVAATSQLSEDAFFGLLAEKPKGSSSPM